MLPSPPRAHSDEYQSASLSPQVYERYYKEVTTLCDDYMLEAPRNWRENFYVADLSRILIISLEIDNGRHRASELALRGPITPPRAFAGPQQPCESLVSSMSTDTETLINSSPSTVTSRTPINVAQPAAGGGRSTLSPQSPFATWSSFASPAQPVETTYCDECFKPFTGTPQDRKSNLKRHKLTTKGHGKGATYKCSFPGCPALYRRTDYLKKHLRKVHKCIKSIGARDAKI